MTTLCCIIPSYNYGRYIETALDSVLSQTRAADEVIVIDDGSTDDTMARLRKYAGRVRIVRNARNLGLAATRNRAIAMTRCDYVVSIDADDWAEPEYFAALAGALDTMPDVGIAYSGVKVWIDPEKRMWENIGWPDQMTDETWAWMCSRSNPPNTCIPASAMYRRDMWERVGGFMESVKRGEDVEFWLRGLTRTPYRAHKVTERSLYVWRYHGGQLSQGAYPDVQGWVPQTRKGRTTRNGDPIVGVVIPVGPGHEQHVVSAIESVLGQTAPDWEMVIVDDTGNGKTAEAMAARYAAQHIEIVKTPGSQGASHARNAGLARISAPFVVFLDADDFLHPFALQVFLQQYIRVGHGYIYSDLFEHKGAGRTGAAHSRQLANDDHVTLACRNGVTSLVRTDDARAVGGFDETMRHGWEDVDFYLKLRVAGICGTRVPQPLYYYRVTSGTLRNLSGEHREELERLIDARYGAYMRGEIKMAGCCGGPGGEELERVKRALQGLPDVPGALHMQEGQVVMQYIGALVASVTWLGKYRAGNNDTDRFVSVDAADVQRLQATGQFVVVNEGGLVEPATLPLEVTGPEPVTFEGPEVAPNAVDERAEEAEAQAEVMDQPIRRKRR